MRKFFKQACLQAFLALGIASAGLVLAPIALAPLHEATARGPGNYAVSGKEGSGGSYTGSAELTQTGESTWRIVWRIGKQVWTGFGIGDGKIIALNFTGNGQSGVMLLVAKDDNSGYDAAWAYTGAKTVGYEEWTK
jgi:hypothetical protein